jgi:hypothetical protein
MIVYLIYLLKVSLCLIVFYFLFTVLYKRTTFFQLNRLYLLLGLALSFIIPLLQFTTFNINSNLVMNHSFNDEFYLPDFDLSHLKISADIAKSFGLFSIISAVYFAGLGFMFFRLLFSIFKVMQIKKNSELTHKGKTRIVLTKFSYAFSFFNTIYLPLEVIDPSDREMIINHEISHIRQFHWFDLLIAEFTAALLWFNPIVILYKNSLRLQHEYLADIETLNYKANHEEYLRCLLKGIQYRNLCGLTNQFFCKTIKKRIIMITKYRSSKTHILKYLIFIPLTGILIFMFSGCQKSASASSASANFFATTNIPDISPVDIKKVKMSSGYGYRVHPITKQKQFHYGVDLALNEGESVVATAAGAVLTTGYDSLKGNFVFIKHDEVYSTLYTKLKEFTVHQGDKVIKNQVIGYVGRTGQATGPHLHYEVYKNGKNVNPSDYMPKK